MIDYPNVEDITHRFGRAPGRGNGAAPPQEPTGFYAPPGEPTAQTPPARRMALEWFDDAATMALDDPSNPLIEDLLDEGSLSVIYGDSNSGKTFVALDMAHSVATGRDWNEKRTRPGFVVYVAAEGGRRITRRIAALRQRYPHEKPLFALVRHPIDLRSSDVNLKELLALIRSAEAKCGERCAWIIVDTLSRALAGGDENSPVDMGQIVKAADLIRSETGAHFSYVHHSGKDAARGARGHSLLRAATDTEIEVASSVIKATKQRDMECGAEFGFTLVDELLGDDPSGRAIKSAVVEWSGAAPAKNAKPTKRYRERSNCSWTRLRKPSATSARKRVHSGRAGRSFGPWPSSMSARATLAGLQRSPAKARRSGSYSTGSGRRSNVRSRGLCE